MRPTPAAAAVAAVVVLALLSALRAGPETWDALRDGRREYAGYSELERRHAPFVAIGLPGEVLDFWADRVVRGDRVYLQVRESGLGRFVDLPTAVRYATHLYLLPAVEADDLEDATVVLTFFDDPSRLGVEFVTQEQAGLQPIYVSRIRAP